MKKQSDTFKPKEVGVLINNALQASVNQQGYSISENRLRKLREFSMYLLEPLQDYTEDTEENPAVLTYEELVCILLASALWVHTSKILQTEKLPMSTLSDILLK